MTEIKPLLAKKETKKSWKFLKKYTFFIAAILLVIVAAFWSRSGNNTGVINYVFGNQSTIKTVDGRINVLLLGIGGDGHDGPNLTDTIMVASVDPKTREADLVSLPRDLWSTKHQVKVNALYQLGIDKGDGLGVARQEIGDMLGVEIPYAVRVDFNGFTKAVDLVGGLDINVAHSFDDYDYPVPGKEDSMCGYTQTEQDISSDQAQTLGVQPGKLKVLLDPNNKIATAAAKPGEDINYDDDMVFEYFPCRYEHLQFKQGPTHMDGATALKFVRSRHGTNGEGSDFARSKRQQLVLQAFKARVVSLDTLTNVGKMVSLVSTFGKSIDTNITQNQYLEFATTLRKVDKVKSYVIDESGEDPLLITPPTAEYGGAWVLTPPKNDFTRIRKYVADILSGVFEASGSAITAPK